MIKTKLFTGHSIGSSHAHTFVDVDEEINMFLSNPKIELIDVKITSTISDENQVWNNALLIYREN